jgi:alpha-1,3-rhamnosyl/mannosyltransferase
MRIVFDASPLLVNKTGVAYYTERLVTSLARQYPDELELVGFYYNFLGKRSVKHLPKASNLVFHAVRFTPSKIIYQLRRWGIELPVEYLSGTKADFVLYPNFLSYPSLRHTPSAPVIHDLTYLDLPETVAVKNRQDLERFVPKAIERSAFVLTVSEFTKKRLVEQYNLPFKKILVTPIPPEEPRKLPNAEQRRLLAKAKINKPFILFVGTVEPRKNLINLVAAYKLLPEDMRNKYSLVIAGRVGWSCREEERAFETAKAEGYDVRHLGYVSENTRTALYQNTELFVTASGYEGYGMPIIEAMNAGAPLSVSNIPVFKEVAGEDAVYFDQTNPASIAESMHKLLSDDSLRAKLSKSGRQHVDSFNWENIAASVYEKILEAVKNR